MRLREYQIKELIFIWLHSVVVKKRPLNETQMQWLMIPEITCMALSIELNLKAMMSYENKDKRETHNIESLLKSLNGKTQEKIISYTEFQSSQFWSDIKIINNAFEEWRYVYEKGGNLILILP